MKSILEYYETYDEEARLIKDNAHKVEFITTVHYLDNIIEPSSRILEVGAGTGRYSFYFAEKGHKVTALDITPKHVEIMKKKARYKDLDIDIVLGNAKELSDFKDDSYDVVSMDYIYVKKYKFRGGAVNNSYSIIRNLRCIIISN